ncbi:beta-ketoacyl-ACP synthase III [Thalassotalea agarivorans]|uniref:Beta-ketodecanoyl-[acyl-carrier-protein] synthase n=1 Tax=Thalassotalea agarivorans TaxID=349064 RepID=A0A1I0AUZ5_THASX|nr:beta-ketoacyl-ACP synthase III [Thalassotalea agarivorans]SES98206.1 beta-ketodecanoyl-[acyl-carrier-protein] synthase [Thalassotalea agarivorans]
MAIVISGSGLFTPPNKISNDELVASFNKFVDEFNATNQDAIAAGDIEALKHSSSEFIEKASGIKNRHIMFKEGVLDTNIMHPIIPQRGNDEISYQAEMGVAAAKQALENANVAAEDIDLVIVACSYTERAYPAIAIEIQQALGCNGWAYDSLVACSSATFGIMNAMGAIHAGTANKVLVVNPEFIMAQLNYKDRDSHFIFGDVATAVVIEREEDAKGKHCFRILSQQPMTTFSNNIRSNFGIANQCDPDSQFSDDKYFVQQGRKVFKEVLPMVYKLIDDQMAANNLTSADLKRVFLHQANINMNNFVARKIFGRDPEAHEAPTILDEYANTASAGSIVAFHKHHDDMVRGDKAIICSFGAGYSAGCLVIEHT